MHARAHSAVLDIYELIGFGAMPKVYTIIYIDYKLPYGVPPEECKQIFVDQAPLDMKPKVSELADLIIY